ncbi:MAG: hypothetical protein U0270_29370 [Labilithrix sp.]
MKRCGRCGATYDSIASLPPMKQYSPAEVAPLVVHWPANVAVDVRQCRRCDSPIACLAPTISG